MRVELTPNLLPCLAAKWAALKESPVAKNSTVSARPPLANKQVVPIITLAPLKPPSQISS